MPKTSFLRAMCEQIYTVRSRAWADSEPFRNSDVKRIQSAIALTGWVVLDDVHICSFAGYLIEALGGIEKRFGASAMSSNGLAQKVTPVSAHHDRVR
jgi:hypothetical protein